MLSAYYVSSKISFLYRHCANSVEVRNNEAYATVILAQLRPKSNNCGILNGQSIPMDSCSAYGVLNAQGHGDWI